MNQNELAASHLFDQGQDAYQAGYLREALELWNKAKSIYFHLGFSREAAACDTNLGVTLIDLGDPQRAIQHFEQARAVYLRLFLEKNVANCYTNIGVALNALGKPLQAIEHHQLAKAVYLRLRFEKEAADCDMRHVLTRKLGRDGIT